MIEGKLMIKGKMPKQCVYDNACKLDKFCMKRSDLSDETGIFKQIMFIVDRLHIKGHIGIDCKKYNHPINFPNLQGVVTVMCEVINSWASGFCHNTKHMNAIRFNFFYSLFFLNIIKLNLKEK